MSKAKNYFRQRAINILRNRYYNLFMNNYRFKELDYQQNDYIFRKLWFDGRIACFRIKHLEDKAYEGLCFVPFAEITFNNYDFAVDVQLINERGVKFIPATRQVVDKDAVIGYANRSKKPVKIVVDYYIERIATYEVLISLQEIVHKSPFLIGVNEDNEEKIRNFMNKLIDEDKPVMFCELDEIQLFKALVSGSPFIIDKLYAQKQAYENELLTYLGIDNLGGSEKKEHLITDEVKSNNMFIKDNADVFVDTMREFGERIGKVFNLPLTLICKSETYLMVEEEPDEENDKTEEDEEK